MNVVQRVLVGPAASEPATEGETHPAQAPRRGWAGQLNSNVLLIVLVADLVLVLLGQFALGAHLLGRSSLSTVTPVLGVLILMSLAQGIVIGTGGIDLSIPANVTLTGTIVLKASGGTNGGLTKAIVIALVACLAIGFVNGTLVEVFGLNALVVTLATGQLIAGVLRLYRGPVPSVSQVPPALGTFAGHHYGGISLILFLALAGLVVTWAVLNLTVAGRKLVASSASGRAARLAGMPSIAYRIGAWMLASLVVGVGAVLLSGQVGSPDLTLGDPYLLATVVAVVLGGAVLTGGRVSPAGIALGAVFIAALDQVLTVRGYSTGV
ncbi:MAG: ribose transport system permease protein, partial [Pseudonocardiales bacterium]|nr:ribose transport system permease protein [Pseudonocardiales bacterium]